MPGKTVEKNILMTIDSLGAGGAEKVVLNLSRQLVLLGHRVTLITMEDRIEYDVDFSVEINSIGFIKRRFEPTFLKYAYKLRHLIDKLEKQYGPFDLIVSHLQLSHRLLSKANIRSAFFCLHSAISPGSLGERKGLRLFFKRRKLKSYLDDRKLVCVSGGIKRDLLNTVHVKPESIQTIYNPIDFELNETLASKPNKYKDLEYIIHVGRLTPAKRHDRLLRAYVKSQIDEKLLLLGDGPLRSEILADVQRLGITDKVIFAGFHQNPFPIMKGARLTVLSSDYEGFGNVLVESLGLAVPVVSTDCPSGPGEILIGSLQKYLAPVGNIDALAEVIRRGLVDAQNGRYPFSDAKLERFDAKHVAKQYLGLAEDASTPGVFRGV